MTILIDIALTIIGLMLAIILGSAFALLSAYDQVQREIEQKHYEEQGF